MREDPCENSLETCGQTYYNQWALSIFKFTNMQLKKTLPAALAAGLLLASCTAKPAEDMPAPIPQANIGEVTTAETATPTENVQAVASGATITTGADGSMTVTADGASATVSSNGVSATTSGASMEMKDGVTSVTTPEGSATTSADGSMTVTSPNAGTMTIENGQIAAPGVSIGADGTVKMDAGAAGAAGMGQ